MATPLITGSKTPVSILQEMCVRKGCPPHYDLIHDGGGTHECIFKFKVDAAGVTAIGSGRSKKEAKHDAARKALEKLAKNEVESPELVVPEDILEVESPYRDKIQENAVGALQDLCAINDCPQPEYKLIGEEGSAHARKFTYLCSVSKHKETGEARTKKQAKQLAASRMLKRLKALPNIVDVSTEKKMDDVDGNEATNEVVTKYLENTSTVVKPHVPMSVPLSDYHNLLTYLSEEIIDSILAKRDLEASSGSEDGECTETDDLTLLKELLIKLEITFRFEEFEVQPEVVFKNRNHLVLLQLDTNPISVLSGAGNTDESAMLNAATNALDYLNIMCRTVRKSHTANLQNAPTVKV